jgi:hypothetical protein
VGGVEGEGFLGALWLHCGMVVGNRHLLLHAHHGYGMAQVSRKGATSRGGIVAWYPVSLGTLFGTMGSRAWHGGV